VPEKVATFNFDGMVAASTFTHNADGSDTTVTTTKGSFSVTSATGGNPTFKLDLALNLTDETLALNNAAGETHNKVNGDVDMLWTPAIAGCAAGKYTVSTLDTAPRIFQTATGVCPINGTVNVNNASINYEPVGQPIQVAVDGGTPQTFADCAAFNAAGGACSF
jgi:hypothetical protein